MLHHDPAADAAIRANIGHGFHFFDPDNERFHKSKTVGGAFNVDRTVAYVVIRLGTVYLGSHCVQTPHSRVVRVDLRTGETDWLVTSGLPTSEMVGDKYVNRGEKHEYRTNAQAFKAARAFAAGKVG